MFYKLLNSYTQRFSFPHRGLKYFLRIMRSLGIADKVYKKKLPGNILINLQPEEHIQQQLFWYGHYEKPLGAVLKQLLHSGDVFLDIGANIGYFSLLAAQAVQDCKVVSFEPVYYLFDALEKNVSLNKGINIQPIKAAVGQKDEERLIYLSAADNSGMSSFQQPENYSGKNEMVKVITLDSWFASAGLNKIDVIKIDVEGNELAVLKGMKEIANRFKPHIVLELNPETLLLFSLTPADLLSYAASLSYRVFAITEEGKLVSINSHNSMETINVALIHVDKINTVRNLL